MIAVVIGGSIAGLAAARALSRHARQVVVLERDALIPGEHRRGVPQSRHPHALLDSGRRDLEALFPGFTARCLRGGALELDPGLDLAYLQPGGWVPRRATGRRLLFASRLLLEEALRIEATALGNVVLRRGVRALSLEVEAAAGGGGRVRGLRVRDETGRESLLPAELVVDAGGRGGGVLSGLGALGLPPVPTTTVDAGAGYCSRLYEAPPAGRRPPGWWWRSVWIAPCEDATRPEEACSGALFPIEGGRWIVTTASFGGLPSPGDGAAFEERLARLRTPLLGDAVRHARPLSGVFGCRGLRSVWRHLERWPARLSGFLAVGDAAASFNPIYGQGMTSAARCAHLLDAALARQDPLAPGFPRRFFSAQAAWLRRPWLLSAARDRQAARAGEAGGLARLRAAGRRAMTACLSQVARAAQDDAVLDEALFELVNLSRTPAEVLASPALWLRVAGARARQLRRGASPWLIDAPLPPAAPSGA